MKLWKTRDGTKIRIRDLDDEHLLNILRLLDRVHEHNVAQWISIPPPHGDIAQDCWEREMDTMLEADAALSFPIYADLWTEALDRELLTSNGLVPARQGTRQQSSAASKEALRNV
jgi:hypothetical protein